MILNQHTMALTVPFYYVHDIVKVRICSSQTKRRVWHMRIPFNHHACHAFIEMYEEIHHSLFILLLGSSNDMNERRRRRRCLHKRIYR
jgi:hypothetical protein